MLKQKLQLKTLSKLAAVSVCAVVLIGGVFGTNNIVRADQYDAKIQALKQQNSVNQAFSNSLAATAASYQQAVNQLQVQIGAMQQAIDSTQNQIDSLQQQINQAQIELDQEKATLGENIKTMYLEGNISTLEILASSKNLSDYVLKQQYRNVVAGKVKTALDKVNSLKAQLVSQQRQQQDLLKQKKGEQDQLVSNQNQQSQLLSYTESQKSTYDGQIRANNAQIVSLRSQQAAAIAALQGANGTSAVGSPIVYKNLTGGVQCGGGYPSEYCTVPLDAWVSDPWGLHYARECVHYVAWALSTQGVNVSFNGNGNANQWQSALAGMATINNDPTGAQMVYLPIAPLGHVAIIDQNYGDGWLHVSQYNWQPGMYSAMDLKVTSNLLFFHF